MTTPIVVWFRRDLRLYDNPALHRACEQSRRIIPVYIHAPEEEHPWAPGGASRWWLQHSLQRLDQALQAYGQKLYYLSGDSAGVLADICARTGARQVVFNHLYEPHLARRDDRVVKQLEAEGIGVQGFHSELFFQPGSLLNKQGGPYRVYTPFCRAARPLLDTLYGDYRAPDCDRQLHRLEPPPELSGLATAPLRLVDAHPWHHKLHRYWQPGERQAQAQLEAFLAGPIEHYARQRDLPALDGTSRLSPHIHFGELTVRQIYGMLQPLLAGAMGTRAADSAERFLGQLLWREFARHVLWHFPRSADHPMDRRFRSGFWRHSRRDFERWTRGDTGVPLVDAGMKQLWESGWMHNRVRMIAASFLVKNLGIDWRQGARWFWDTLVDADLPNNAMGWQWVAGCGVDAAPYYRIFNPLTQARRFDPDSAYLDRWLPHHREGTGPAPMVDLARSREQALQRFRQYMSRQE